MITWMQKHRKWLVITIWVSTIAFIGAGAVDWGHYSYGRKSGVAAKVGDIKITYSEFNDAYGRLYERYKQMFQGRFTKEEAKAMGLQKHALASLIDQALLLNLAKNYGLTVSNREVYNQLITQKVFFKNGVFNDKTYKAVLAANNLDPQKYESQLRKELLLQKTLELFPITATPLEKATFSTIFNIQDKIRYKVLSFQDVKIDTAQAKLKKFWQANKQYFLTQPAYKISYITQKALHSNYSDAKIADYYDMHKQDFADKNGKIPPLAKAKKAVIAALDEKETKIAALKTYIAMKKGEVSKEDAAAMQHTSLSKSHNIFDAQTFMAVTSLTETKSVLKPQRVNGHFVIIRLDKKIPSQPQSFAEAKKDVLYQYTLQMKQKGLKALAKKSYKTFKGGITTPMTSIKDTTNLKGLSQHDAEQFLSQLFMQQHKKGYISLQDNKIVLYDILAQNLLNRPQEDISAQIVDLKQQLFNQSLINVLNKRFKTEIYMKGM
jgi:peptidyl-prolyl cis-trans isomerase D